MRNNQKYFETIVISLTNPRTGEEANISVRTVMYDEETYKACMILSWSPQPDWVTEEMIDREIN